MNQVYQNHSSNPILTTQEADVLIALSKQTFYSQRELASFTGHALGMVNKAVRSLQDNGLVDIATDSYGDNRFVLTEAAEALLSSYAPEQAIILAAGFGMRMVPINLETPKALLTVNGERLIERIINQLNNAGIKGSNIHIVVGFMKEKFEYLMDKYGVDLIVNSSYASHNNISSLALASKYIDNSYIVPSDVWCEKNPFNSRELYSWYMVSDEIDDDSDVRVNRKNELVRVKGSAGNAMVGISYLCGDISDIVRKRVEEYNQKPQYDSSFWEEALYGRTEDGEEENKMIVQAKVVHSSEVVEINTYEQLRDLDDESSELQSDAIDTIKSVFNCKSSDITDITVLKKGMTNRSFLFTVSPTSNISATRSITSNAGASNVNGEQARQGVPGAGKYIMRIPGEGTDKLINRAHEADVYKAISGKGLCDDPVYMNPSNGYKITKFLDGVRCCNSEDDSDLTMCMKKLRYFHNLHLQVSHTFDIFGQADFYESLWNGASSMYGDHKQTTEHVKELKEYIDAQDKDWCLTHIDAVPDNFLFYHVTGDTSEGVAGEAEEEQLQLTDWEYAGMQDPHVDIAMFCIYSLYDKDQVDHLIDIYFAGNDGTGSCPNDVRTKIYCYIAACGLLWSNWCEYKAHLGVEFGEYSLRQYRFAKDYYKYATERMK